MTGLQEFGLPAKFPTRINISYTIDDDLSTYVVALNRMISERWSSEIEFGDGVAIPHMTILMGQVFETSAYLRILDTVRQCASSLSLGPYVVSKPYRPSPGSGFVFLDVQISQGVQECRLNLANQIDGLMKFDRNGGPENDAHVTISYSPTLPESDLRELPVPMHCSGLGNYIQVGSVGPRGTLINRLAVFPAG